MNCRACPPSHVTGRHLNKCWAHACVVYVLQTSACLQVPNAGQGPPPPLTPCLGIGFTSYLPCYLQVACRRWGHHAKANIVWLHRVFFFRCIRAGVAVCSWATLPDYYSSEASDTHILLLLCRPRNDSKSYDAVNNDASQPITQPLTISALRAWVYARMFQRYLYPTRILPGILVAYHGALARASDFVLVSPPEISKS